jgi:hypothetical protein
MYDRPAGNNLARGLMMMLQNAGQGFAQAGQLRQQRDFQDRSLALREREQGAEREDEQRRMLTQLAMAKLGRHPQAPDAAYDDVAGIASGRAVVAPPSANPLTRASAETTTAGLQFLRPQYQPPQRMPGLFAGRDLGPTQDTLDHTQALERDKLTLERQEKVAGLNHQGTLAEIAARAEEARKTEEQKAAARKDLAGITTGPRHDANRTRIAALYLAAGGQVEFLPQFMAGFAEPKAPEVGPALPPMQFGGGLDAGKLFPNGTAAQSRMGLQKSQQGVNEARVPLIGAQENLANVKAADVPVAAQDRRTRTGAAVENAHTGAKNATTNRDRLTTGNQQKGLDRASREAIAAGNRASRESVAAGSNATKESIAGAKQHQANLRSNISAMERELKVLSDGFTVTPEQQLRIGSLNTQIRQKRAELERAAAAPAKSGGSKSARQVYEETARARGYSAAEIKQKADQRFGKGSR